MFESSLYAYGMNLPVVRSAPELKRQQRGRFHDMPNDADNFGAAYNAIVHQAFNLGYERVIICNDDIVLRPDTLQLLQEDLAFIEKRGIVWGHVATRSDMVRRGGGMHGQFIGENDGERVRETRVVSPLCSIVQPSTWVDFPPVNSYSDDVQCWDMRRAGARVFVSRAYVHHVGGISIADRSTALQDGIDAVNKLRKIREDFVNESGLFAPNGGF